MAYNVKRGVKTMFFNLDLENDTKIRMNSINYGDSCIFYLSVINEEHFNEVYMDLNQVKELHRKIGDLIQIQMENKECLIKDSYAVSVDQFQHQRK